MSGIDCNSEMDSPKYVFFYILGSISIACGLYVIVDINRIGLQSISTRLVLFLQLSNFFVSIFDFPFIYTHPNTLCIAMSALRQYFQMFNLTTNLAVSFGTYGIIFSSTESRYSLNTWMQAMIFVLPIIELMPTTTGSLGETSSFCSFKIDNNSSQTWFDVILAIQFVIISASVALFVIIVLKLRSSGPENYPTIYRVVRGSGLYSIVTVALWAPKMFTLNSIFDHQSTVSLTVERSLDFVTGIMYFLIYLLERDTLVAFESYVAENNESFVASFDEGGLSSSIMDRDREAEPSAVLNPISQLQSSASVSMQMVPASPSLAPSA